MYLDEFRCPSEAREKGIEINGGVGAVPIFDRSAEEPQGGCGLAAIGQVGRDKVIRFRVVSRLQILRELIDLG